ncbi:acyltransferase family protein [Burkholderia mayonis]|uniref:Acyltransferase 3 domain-containing protein n=1 Tax=Burkholderia mayonis TaxID=1385591 RepID=A0A1B4FS34_9BURK|nr:acyltransferase [Burkholderia mayonis]AOJ06495.1 hypothetical protein WS71_03520 [Burkholderia mayonis]
MTIYSVAPYFLTVGVVTLLFCAPCFARLDQPPAESSTRTLTLDGIRGFLALSVMIDHAVVTYRWLRTGEWIVPPAAFYDQLGTLSVAIFFMITGFLFWRKMIAANGRPRFLSLYIGRVFRISPVYLLAIGLMFLIVFQRTGFTLYQAPSELAAALLKWLALGMVGGPDFNGYVGAWMILAGVTWTLKYEWLFYLSLLATAWFAKPRTQVALPFFALVTGTIGAIVWPNRDWSLGALFAAGMLVAALPGCQPRTRLAQSVQSIAAIGLLATIFIGWTTPFGPAQVLIAAIFFYLLCSGTTIFGLLRTLAAQRLGYISYSVYLMHGIVLTIAFASPGVHEFALRSDTRFWLVILACTLIVSVGASAIYLCIEQPGIRAGQRLIRRLRRATPMPTKTGGSPQRV